MQEDTTPVPMAQGIPLPPVQARADVVTPTFRDGLGPGTSIDDFSALSVRRRGPHGPVEVVKVLVDDLDTPSPTVYYIQTKRHETHWWFAKDLLGARFHEGTFARRTYHRVPRPAVALNLVRHLGWTVESSVLGHPVAEPITIERGDDDTLPPHLALQAIEVLQQRFAPAPETQHRLMWLPPDEAGEQTIDVGAFVRSGVAVLRRSELHSNTTLQVLNPGVAVGILRDLTERGTTLPVLSSRDIVLLTYAPNDLPVVAGTITQQFQTPLSHVAIAARSRGTPNIALPNAAKHPHIAPYLGQLVQLTVTDERFTVAPISMAEATAYWNSGAGPVVQLPAVDVDKRGWLDLDTLDNDDVSSIGAKAAGLAELRRCIPDASPTGIVVPFSYYNDFITQSHISIKNCRLSIRDCVEEGRDGDLCEAVARRCVDGAVNGHSFLEYITQQLADPVILGDAALREALLDGFQFQMTHHPIHSDVAADLDQAVRERWGEQPVRLRSSTNAEDLADFTGAGLYRSVRVSSHERPSSEVRKVWASTWSFRAVEERTAWRIKHNDVQMAVLVHAAYEGETANGVLVTTNLSGPEQDVFTINLQPGNLPVTNPEDGALPEVLVVSPHNQSIQRTQFATTSPDTPVLSDTEVWALTELAEKVQQHFAMLRPGDVRPLDMEWRRTATGALHIKQARPWPVPQTARNEDDFDTTPY